MSEALDIDLYQASMLRAYFHNNMHNLKGSMEAFARRLPNNRSFFVVCGIDRIVDYLNTVKFTTEDIKLLRSIESLNIDDSFANYLISIDFAKELKLIRMFDGEIAFPNEPVLRIEGPIGLCQYVEKKILSIINHDVRIASKAARVVLAAKGRPVFEFGGRRAHDASSADTARAAYIVGCAGTSNVLAHAKYGVPVVGTQGHVWIMSHETEDKAFNNWNNTYPNSTYLVDTYHSRDGVECAIKNTDRGKLGAVRLDSGDLLFQSCEFRRLLINSDNVNTRIIASDDLNEYKIQKLLNDGAQIDAFGVGTEIVSTPDAPTCGFVYKLVDIEGPSGIIKDICKISASKEKSTLPGKKQVWRHFTSTTDNKIIYTHDTIEKCVDYIKEIGNGFAVPILRPGKLFIPETSTYTEVARKYFQGQLSKMPDHLKLITENGYVHEYQVLVSDKLQELKRDILNKAKH